MWAVTDEKDLGPRRSSVFGESYVNLLDDRSAIVFLQYPALVGIKGCADVECLYGELIVLGYRIRPGDKPQRIYSLDTEVDMVFETIAGTFNPNTPELDRLKIDFTIRNEVRAKRVQYDCIFVLRNCYEDMKEWDQFLRVRGYKLFPPSSRARTYKALRCELKQTTINDKKILTIPHEWLSIGEKFATNQQKRLVVCGQKGAGKSTFVRWLTNYLLGHYPFVIIIDTDPGQSEFSVPGCVSAVRVTSPLLGPNYTHFKESLRSIYVKAVDITWSKEYYIPALDNILEYVLTSESYGSAPIVINTMGFVHGLGLEVLNSIISKSKASHVVLLSSRCQGETFDPKKLVKNIPYDLDVVDSVAKLSNSDGRLYTPSIRREICVLSYFPLYCLSDESASQTPKIFDLRRITFTPKLKAPLEPTSVVVLGREENKLFFVIGFGLVHAQRQDAIYVWSPIKAHQAREVTHISRHIHLLRDYSAKLESNFWSGSFPQVTAVVRRGGTKH